MSETIALRTRGREDWGTPQWLFEELNAEFGFDVDACATADNAKLPRYYDLAADALRLDWRGTVFMNPPYRRQLDGWMKKAAQSAADFGTTIVALVPARTDVIWWHRHAMRGEIRFIRGRLRFAGAKHSAPFPSAVVVVGPGGAGPGKVSSMSQKPGRDLSPVLFAVNPAQQRPATEHRAPCGTTQGRAGNCAGPRTDGTVAPGAMVILGDAPLLNREDPSPLADELVDRYPLRHVLPKHGRVGDIAPILPPDELHLRKFV